MRVDYLDRDGYIADWTENLSAGGLFVRTDTVYREGDSVRVSISFPGLLEPVEIVGSVAWVRPEAGARPRGIGLRVETEIHRRKLAELALLASDPTKLPTARTYRVLVVEDNDAIMHMYKRVLARMAEISGGSVQAAMAHNGHEAMQHLQEQSFDLVLSDLYMPVMDGFALIQRMRGDPALRAVPILLVTCGGDEERDRAERLGVDAYLQKPVQFGQLLETIVCLLRRSAEGKTV